MQISGNNQLDWKRSDMFADGIITSRGYLDLRIDHGDSMFGEVRVDKLNPKNVIPDPDAEDYDPDTWADVFTTKWLTPDDIEVLYNKADADYLRSLGQSSMPYGMDSVQALRDRMGDHLNPMYSGGFDHSNVMRNLRVLDRQYRKMDRQKHFVSVDGDMRQIPVDWDRNRIAFYVERFGFQVITKLVRRIRWTVTCDNVVLHDDWSPYKHFTVVPYYPYFRHGHTLGLTENLLDPQDLLNKATSQELHVINTTANSGYKVKAGALANMTIGELEHKGAQTGIVIEVNGDPNTDVQKIEPNQIPQGLDRMTFKAEEHIKGISGISDSMQGFDREDVAAKAIQAKRQAGSTNLVKPLDNLQRTDFILARNTLDLIQGYYTEQRVLTIVHDQATGATEDFTINQVTPEGQVVNDLTIGEYTVSVTNVPMRDALEDSQFEQAMALREAGIMIPDSVLVDSSRLMNKKDIIKQMQGDQESPEAQAQAELQRRAQEAEVSKLEGEAASKHADATLKNVKAQVEANTPPETGDPGNPALEMAQAQHEMDLEERRFAHEVQMDQMELELEERKQANELQLKAADQAQKREDARAERARAAAQAATQPKPAQGAKQ